MRLALAALALALAVLPAAAQAPTTQYYQLEKGDYPHDVAVGADGMVWFAGQKKGIAGRLDPASGKVTRVPLGKNSAPHGVIIGPDNAPWFTDGGQNAIVRVDPASLEVKVWPLPPERMPYTNLNTAAFDGRGRIWFTGQNGIYGRLDPKTGDMKVWDAPKGRGPYGITGTPKGEIYFVSLAGSYMASVDLDSGAVAILGPPTLDQGARRVWADSKGLLWVSEWNSGNVSVYDPATKTWKKWKLPGEKPKTYSVWVDPDDKVWLTDWAANAVVRFDPATEKFEVFASDKQNSNVRQMHGRRGEAWAPESGSDRIRVIRYPVKSG